jgi:Kef-type K+ transport system membrane component KefB
MIFTIVSILVISPFFAKLFRLPTAPVEIVLGSLAAFISLLQPTNHIFFLMSEVGFFYLMFLAGAEVNLNILLKLDRKIVQMGVFYLLFLYIFSFIFVKIFNFPLIFILMFALISVGLIVSLFKEFGKDKKWLDLSMNIGVLGELLSIILLTIAATLLDKDSSGNEIFKSVAILAVFIIGVFIIFRVVKVIFWWHPEWKNFLVPKYQDKDEKDIRTSMSIFFFMVALMYVLDIEIVFGAFVAGMFIATFFEHKKQLPHKLGTFGFGFLIPIFFIHVGSTLDIALLSMDLIVKAVIVTFIMIFVRVLSAQVFKTFLNFKEIILFALSHSMPLTLLIAIATLAHTGGAIDDFYYYVFVCASLFEVIISMSIIMLLGRSKITFSSFR